MSDQPEPPSPANRVTPGWADLLDQLPDIRQGQYGMLVVETDDLRVWLARGDNEDPGAYPAAYARSVIVERRTGPMWDLMGEVDGDRAGSTLPNTGTLRRAHEATVAMVDAASSGKGVG